jgi:c-di-GMP-binding flagellar brake protein YcgR
MDDLRRYLRASIQYRIEYGPFPLSSQGEDLKESFVNNISAGGLMFTAADDFSPGRQLVIKIYVPGWRQNGDEIIENSEGDAEELQLVAIAEVTRSIKVSNAGVFEVGVKFIGRIH